jgi:hypothetical protein
VAQVKKLIKLLYMYKIIFVLIFFSSSISFSQRIFRDDSTGKYGVKDKNDAELIKADYDDIQKLDRLNNFRAVKENVVFFYNNRGELLNTLRFDELGRFEFNAARIKQNGRYGVINEFGDITIPVIYDDLIWSIWSYAAVSKNGRWGIADLSGNIIAPIVYDTIIGFPSSVEFAIVKQNGKYGILDMISGVVTYKCELDDFYFTKFNYVKAIINGRTGLLHYDGTLLASIDYDDVLAEEDAKFSRKYVYVKSGIKWGVNNIKNETLFPVEYDALSPIDRKGIITARKDGKDVFLDVRKGEIK